MDKTKTGEVYYQNNNLTFVLYEPSPTRYAQTDAGSLQFLYAKSTKAG
jgi:hypothetical protein